MESYLAEFIIRERARSPIVDVVVHDNQTTFGRRNELFSQFSNRLNEPPDPPTGVLHPDTPIEREGNADPRCLIDQFANVHARSPLIPQFAQIPNPNRPHSRGMQNDFLDGGEIFGTNRNAPNTDHQFPNSDNFHPLHQSSHPLVRQNAFRPNQALFAEQIPLQGHFNPCGGHNGLPNLPPAEIIDGQAGNYAGHVSNVDRGRIFPLRPDSFDGTGRVDNFLIKFELCADYHRWSEKEKALMLKCSLQNDAIQLLLENDSKTDISYVELVEKLRQRYGSVGRDATYRSELNLRKQKDRESLRDLMTDMKRLMSLAYRNAKGETADSILCDAFVNALSDWTLARRIRELEPQNIDIAFHHAIRLEAYRDMYDEEELERKRRPQRFVRGTVDEETQSPILNKLDEILKIQEENFHSW